MERLKQRYPKKVKCRQDCEVVIRPLEPEDVEQEVAFLRGLDQRDKSKLPNDPDDHHYLQKMRHMLEDGLVYTLLAYNGDDIVGALTLYRGRSTWEKHTGEVVTVTHPDFRRAGIATILMNEIIPLAEDLGMEKLYVHLMEEHRAAIKLFKQIGFQREATLKDHVCDRYGRYHNLRIYSMDLAAAHKAMDELISHFHDYSG